MSCYSAGSREGNILLCGRDGCALPWPHCNYGGARAERHNAVSLQQNHDTKTCDTAFARPCPCSRARGTAVAVAATLRPAAPPCTLPRTQRCRPTRPIFALTRTMWPAARATSSAGARATSSTLSAPLHWSTVCCTTLTRLLD
eukprot:scaffold41116_cov51-Phaeocystis_antarctica.AAC.1